MDDHCAYNVKSLVFSGAIDHWPALRSWTPDYLRRKIGDTEVTIDVTPNGKGDAVTRCTQYSSTAHAVPHHSGQPPEQPSCQPLSGSATSCSTTAHVEHSCDGNDTDAEVGPGRLRSAARLQPLHCFATPHERCMRFTEFLDFFYNSKTVSVQNAKADPASSVSNAGGQTGSGPHHGHQPHEPRQQQRDTAGIESCPRFSCNQTSTAAASEPSLLHSSGQTRQHSSSTNAPSAGRQVPYLQHQNNNLAEELPQLFEDMEEHLGWANEAFGCTPDAVNIWIGDARSTTSFHKGAKPLGS